ncbi:hypothetical protein DI272_10160 [Streptomyces sp. Act143]|uniref:hypothetical protein n=1 Tax=Streptomyces sp. Act143 TaxID=2200760 RepID=UPI000D675037|nr:hypothetical protein [Streptomyces sp. Act143]PWI14474.1 hypothetical protein DI272_10160 [Streptomyces sp. Act143]
MNDALAQLRTAVSLLREGGAAGDEVDWPAAAAELGVASFPEDYVRLVDAYGAGSFEDALFISIPRPGSPSAPLTVGRLPDDAVTSMSEWQEPTLRSRHSLTDMLVWGQTNAADALCWITSDVDPQRWPVAVWQRQGGGWKTYDCGAVEFLVRLLRGDFSECPVSDESLWRARTARFLNFRDEVRLLGAGVDPWTGESTDPFADL